MNDDIVNDNPLKTPNLLDVFKQTVLDMHDTVVDVRHGLLEKIATDRYQKGKMSEQEFRGYMEKINLPEDNIEEVIEKKEEEKEAFKSSLHMMGIDIQTPVSEIDVNKLQINIPEQENNMPSINFVKGIISMLISSPSFKRQYEELQKENESINSPHLSPSFV